MTLAQHAIGIDVSRDWLDGFDSRSGKPFRIANCARAITAFLKKRASGELIVIEATAPYDMPLRRLAARFSKALVRVNPARARDFARALGALAKTDAIDARILATMGVRLELAADPPHDEAREKLAALHRRRDQLVAIRAAEATRLAGVTCASERRSLQRHIVWLSTEIESLENKIEDALSSPALTASVKILRSLVGIGKVTTATLIALLPELGRRSPREIAALAGLAPMNRDSGQFRGQRHIAHGRRRVRQALYMAALAAIRCLARFKDVYLRIKLRSGKAKIAVCAVARKLLVTLNAMMRDSKPFQA